MLRLVSLIRKTVTLSDFSLKTENLLSYMEPFKALCSPPLEGFLIKNLPKTC